ncbi:MAG: hypothetical protein JOZ81_11285 [Chloroflexi bacterium]|nr:hypothetical protein [Chloroflexota bacterium]
MPDSIGLADFIAQVRAELMQPEAESVNAPKLLMVEEVELQIQVGVTRQANGGLNVQVVQLGGSAKRDDVHTVKVRLEPVLNHDQRLAELMKDPRWDNWKKEIVEHTSKGIDGRSQREV